ncbi:phosphate acetyltransferase [Aliiroseovarius sp. F47248L]|uniref:phosphate acetyltransferase n=1 Tax=Aliiroseovarius sp. F47248L TaxID=2926420 RepID=UPI001FF43700|nr:phosphate acetyltransferase [Aliiroseovarius sp. F47248L]MCK0139214.1 phosphate acetyltransferase [Aliiroseovarius sp. F47248L]
MKPLETLLSHAARSHHRIMLSEGTALRVVQAAYDAATQGIARIGLVGNRDGIENTFRTLGLDVVDGITLHDPAKSTHLPELTALYHDLRQHKGVTRADAETAVLNPHVFAALMVKAGHADGTVGGAVATTAEIVRTAIQIIGTKPGNPLVSSFFLMLFCEVHHARKGAMIFADSGLVVDPTAEEMAQIALSSADSFITLTGEVPRVAMLSFSTRGSSEHHSVSKVVTATGIAKNRAPDLLIDGELQFDAAFVPDVAARKAQGSPLEGSANVFIFPNLESGNIAYKIAQRVGGATAIGPVLQGLSKPANDLSRGCTAEDILHMIAVTAAQASAAT